MGYEVLKLLQQFGTKRKPPVSEEMEGEKGGQKKEKKEEKKKKGGKKEKKGGKKDKKGGKKEEPVEEEFLIVVEYQWVGECW